MYVDGYNFYYGLLSGTPYKWLNLKSLLQALLREHEPEAELIGVKFFTSDVLTNLARHGQDSQRAQQIYHRALQTQGVALIKGFHSLSPSLMPMRDPAQPKNYDCEVAVWKLEEKQTDVNLALNVYADAVHNRCEQVLICSNDTDLEPALKLVYETLNTRIGVIFPRRAEKNSRPPSAGLQLYAH